MVDLVNVLTLTNLRFTMEDISEQPGTSVWKSQKILYVDFFFFSRVSYRWLHKILTPNNKALYCIKNRWNHQSVLRIRATSPYIVDLIISYFHWFGPFKEFLRGTKFSNEDDVIKWLKTQLKDFCVEEIQNPAFN